MHTSSLIHLFSGSLALSGITNGDTVAEAESVQALVNVGEAFKALEQQAGRHGHRLPHFPAHAALPHTVRVMTRFPALMGQEHNSTR